MRKLSEIFEELTGIFDVLIDAAMVYEDEELMKKIENIEQELYDYSKKLEN